MNLQEVKAEIDRRAALIGASGNLLPTYGNSDDFARPHIEIDDRGYHYVIVERGQERSRETTPNFDELLYHVFKAVTSTLSGNYEVRHRIRGEDSRRQLFRHQIELLAKLDPQWAVRRMKEQNLILQDHPFEDDPGEEKKWWQR